MNGHPARWGRRELFRAGAATAGALLTAAGARPLSAAPGREFPPDIYTRIGARPFINCTATVTINGGSRLLPEVIGAIERASYYHVNLDALMEAAGKRLAQLLKADWAMVTAGAAAALVHATAACVAGADPERIQQLPDLAGLKNEVIIPRSSRNVYDQAVRNAGVRTVQVDTVEEFRAAINSRTAMAMILGNRFEKVPCSLGEVAPIARQAGVPVLVDAAADYLIVPNPYLAAGADLVAYSGGKILRGPQSAGLLLGREDLVRAALANSAPHHALGRPMKVSKEEIVGMVAAVEVWVSRRDLDKEYAEWEGWYRHIAETITRVDGVSAAVEPPSRGGPFPTLKISWDPDKIGLTAGQLHDLLLNGEPAIQTHAAGDGHEFLLRPVAMKPGEYRIIARRLREIFERAPRHVRKPMAPPAADVAGRWEVEVKFLRGEARHQLFLETEGNRVSGTHLGSVARGPLEGTIEGDQLYFRSGLPLEGVRLSYEFHGILHGDVMEGELDLGEYPKAQWRARRVRPA